MAKVKVERWQKSEKEISKPKSRPLYATTSPRGTISVAHKRPASIDGQGFVEYADYYSVLISGLSESAFKKLFGMSAPPSGKVVRFTAAITAGPARKV